MVLVTSTCLFFAYVLRRRCLGKKDEGEVDGETPAAAVTGAGGIGPSEAAGGGGGMRRHAKAALAVMAVLALASIALLVASRQTRAGLNELAAGRGALVFLSSIASNSSNQSSPLLVSIASNRSVSIASNSSNGV